MDLDTRSRENDLISVVRELVRELSPQRLKRGDVTLASRLDRDLGVDSLGRTELVLRMERKFRVRLSINAVAEMETVADLLKAVEQGAPSDLKTSGIELSTFVPETPLIGQPDDAKTLTEMLDWHVENHPDHLHVTVLQDENTVLGTMSYRDLQTAARAVAQGLISRDIVPGDRVAMMLPTSTDFFASFFGVLYAGAVPVPIYPPARMAQLEEHMRRQIAFLVRPATWLWAMHKYRATFSGGPNFAFELCASRIPDEDLQGLDLSALRFVVNGAEPISPQTLRKFTDRFANYGMSRGVPSPSYGLAENCVGLCFPPFGRGPLIDRIKRESLAKRSYAEPADAADADAIEMVACGHPIEKNDVRIVDDAGRELGERYEGMLEFRGPSITKGYFRNEAKTREL